MNDTNMKMVLFKPAVKNQKQRLVTYSLSKLFSEPKAAKSTKGLRSWSTPFVPNFRRPLPVIQPLYEMDPSRMSERTMYARLLTGARHLIRQVQRDTHTRNVNRAWNQFSVLRQLPDSGTYLMDDTTEDLVHVTAPTALLVSKGKPRHFRQTSDFKGLFTRDSEMVKTPAGYELLFIPKAVSEVRPPVNFAFSPLGPRGFVSYGVGNYAQWHGDVGFEPDQTTQVVTPATYHSGEVFSGQMKLPGVTLPSRKFFYSFWKVPTRIDGLHICHFKLSPKLSDYYLKIVASLRNRIKKIGRKIDRFPYCSVGVGSRMKIVPVDTRARYRKKRQFIARCSRLAFAIMRRFDLQGHNWRTWLREKIGVEKYRLLRRSLRIMRRRQIKSLDKKFNICRAAELRRKGIRKKLKRLQRHSSNKYQFHVSKAAKRKIVYRVPRRRRKIEVKSWNSKSKIVKAGKTSLRKLMRTTDSTPNMIISRPGIRVHFNKRQPKRRR